MDQEQEQYNVRSKPMPAPSDDNLAALQHFLTPRIDNKSLDHINTNMTFNNLNFFERRIAQDRNMVISMCSLMGWKQSEFLERSRLEAELALTKSKEGKSMDLVIKSIVHQEQEFKDKTDKRRGFGLLGRSSKKKMR